MKLKDVKCPNCNANVAIKENAKKGKCEYCQSEFLIDDGTVKIEYTGTIEVTSDTSLKIANATLDKFKDYEQASVLYRSLLRKYAHKPEVYIGLIRSITHDFKVEDFNTYQVEELNEFWDRYIRIADNKDISKYEKSFNELNKKHWYKKLLESTNNFNSKTKNKSIDIIEKYYNNYIKYSAKNEKENLDFKYKPFRRDYELYLKELNNNRKRIIKGILLIIAGILLYGILFFLTENTKTKVDSLKLSEVNEHYYNIEKDYQYFEKFFKDTISELSVKDVKLNNEDKTVSITVNLKNFLSDRNKVFNFKIVDDMGPVISPTSCTFNDTEEVDVYKCFTLYDFTDGAIDSNKARLDVFGIDLKKDGIKNVIVTVADKEGNENTLSVPVIITKTPIELSFEVNDNLVVGNTYDLSYSVKPNIVSDTKVTYTYDDKLVKISNNKVTALKKGKTEICAVSNYNNEIKKCKSVNLELQCKDTYVFNFDGSKEDIIVSDENFCPGTYKIYASVMNRDKFYHLSIKPKNSFIGESLTIFKNSSHLNEEGQKYVLTEGYSITTEIGITQVKLVKQK